MLENHSCLGLVLAFERLDEVGPVIKVKVSPCASISMKTDLDRSWFPFHHFEVDSVEFAAADAQPDGVYWSTEVRIAVYQYVWRLTFDWRVLSLSGHCVRLRAV